PGAGCGEGGDPGWAERRGCRPPTGSWPCWTRPRRRATAPPTRARRGFAGDAVLARRGGGDADRIDSLGNAGGAWVRARRLLSFTIADQMVDLAVYEGAPRGGRHR